MQIYVGPRYSVEQLVFGVANGSVIQFSFMPIPLTYDTKNGWKCYAPEGRIRTIERYANHVFVEWELYDRFTERLDLRWSNDSDYWRVTWTDLTLKAVRIEIGNKHETSTQ